MYSQSWKLLKKFEPSGRWYESHLAMQHLFGFVFKKETKYDYKNMCCDFAFCKHVGCILLGVEGFWTNGTLDVDTYVAYADL